MKKEYKLLIILLIILFVLLFTINMFTDKTICKDDSYCSILKEDRKKVKKMKFNDNQYYNFIAIQDKGIENIEGLEKHEEIEFLDLSYNKINQIQGLDSLENLETLDLSYNNISNIKGLENLKSIKYIYLQGNPITRLENIEKIPSKQVDIYVPYDITSITIDSYDYIKDNEINIYFVKNGDDIHSGISSKTIDDLEKV